ncbi:MAG: ankyrin repeat domain-containing protein [Azoarcus sp.]|nr:ankyrin repeat domain-containing protein [Azoarcus sp.]
MGTATEEDLKGFQQLLNAVLDDPDTVPAMVCGHPEWLECVNNSAETVLHWLAVEGHVEGIKLLHRLGSAIPPFALTHALQAGHVETVDLLLTLGGSFGNIDPLKEICNPLWQFTPAKQKQLLACLEAHGYKV